MANQTPVKIVLGSASIGGAVTGADAEVFLDEFRKHGHVEIDTAAMYPITDIGASERFLGQHAGWATISTKVSGIGARPHSRENYQESLRGSQEKLNGLPIDIYYFHMPDGSVPIEEQAASMDEAYRAGKFKRFGISNFSPQQVEDLMKVVEKYGYVKPSVLQGQYNLFARKGEEELLPVLRKHGIAYYAYSPAAAGMLTGKVSRETTNNPDSRWSKTHMGGQLYAANYHHDPIFEASQKVQDVAKKHGIKGHAASLRWCIHHSALSAEQGDAVIIGASSTAQLKENLEICEAGPLPEEVVETIESVWPSVKEVAPWAWMQVEKTIDVESFSGGKMDDLGVRQ